MQVSRKCQHEIYECVILVAVKTVVHASESDDPAGVCVLPFTVFIYG